MTPLQEMTNDSRIPRRPVRVLHIVGTMNRGGAENWLMSLLRKADRQLLQMEFCALFGERGCYSKEIQSLEGCVFPCSIRPIFTFSRRLGRILQDGNYDVVHAHVWLFSGLILKIAHRYNVPIRIVHCHTTRHKSPSLYRTVYAWYMRSLIGRHATHRLGCASEGMVALFGSDWQSIENSRILYCSTSTDFFRPGQPPSISKADFGIPSDAVVIGHVGNFHLAKNHTFLLDIAYEILKREPRAWFLLAGDGELRRQAEAKAERLGISNRVIFAGNREDVPQLMMNLFDVFLFPSVYEGMPLTLVEAAAAGLRTVCSDVITKEATDVLPEAFTRLSLDLGPTRWAEAVNEAIKKGRIPCDYAYNSVKQSHFSDEFSLRELKKIYGCA